MRVAIMQPYFFPYIGYYQLLNGVDKFVVYDNIEFTRKGWINRNRILVNGHDEYITLPLRKGSDYLHVKDRYLADTWPTERTKMLNRISGSYRKAPYYHEVMPMIEEAFGCSSINLFDFLLNSLNTVTQFLHITTPMIISSEIAINHDLKSQDKVLAICKAIGATTYVNPMGGVDLYDNHVFSRTGLDLRFLKPEVITYKQFNSDFCPSLSIIDVLMFNSRSMVANLLNRYSLQ